MKRFLPVSASVLLADTISDKSTLGVHHYQEICSAALEKGKMFSEKRALGHGHSE